MWEQMGHGKRKGPSVCSNWEYEPWSYKGKDPKILLYKKFLMYETNVLNASTERKKKKKKKISSWLE